MRKSLAACYLQCRLFGAPQSDKQVSSLGPLGHWVIIRPTAAVACAVVAIQQFVPRPKRQRVGLTTCKSGRPAWKLDAMTVGPFGIAISSLALTFPCRLARFCSKTLLHGRSRVLPVRKAAQ